MSFIQNGEIKYINVEDKAEEKQILNIGHMGVTTCEYADACKVHTFVEVCPLSKMKEGEEGISWHELFVLYKMCGGKDMLHKPMSGAQKEPLWKSK